jgi:tetratricopeptide (TPR) repeat protein
MAVVADLIAKEKLCYLREQGQHGVAVESTGNLGPNLSLTTAQVAADVLSKLNGTAKEGIIELSKVGENWDWLYDTVEGDGSKRRNSYSKPNDAANMSNAVSDDEDDVLSDVDKLYHDESDDSRAAQVVEGDDYKKLVKTYSTLSTNNLHRHNSRYLSDKKVVDRSEGKGPQVPQNNLLESLATTKRLLRITDKFFDAIHREIDSVTYMNRRNRQRRRKCDTYTYLVKETDIQATLANAFNRDVGDVSSMFQSVDVAVNNYFDAMTLYKNLFGEHSLRAADLSFELGELHRATGKYSDSKLFYETALAIYKVRFEAPNQRVGHTLCALAEALLSVDPKKDSLCKRLLEEGLYIFMQVYSEDHPTLLATRDRILSLHSFRLAYNKAESQLAEQLNRSMLLLKNTFVPDARRELLPALCNSLIMSGRLYLRAKKSLKAVTMFRTALTYLPIIFGATSVFLGDCLYLLAGALVTHSQLDVRGTLEIWGDREPDWHGDAVEIIEDIGDGSDKEGAQSSLVASRAVTIGSAAADDIRDDLHHIREPLKPRQDYPESRSPRLNHQHSCHMEWFVIHHSGFAPIPNASQIRLLSSSITVLNKVVDIYSLAVEELLSGHTEDDYDAAPLLHRLRSVALVHQQIARLKFILGDHKGAIGSLLQAVESLNARNKYTGRDGSSTSRLSFVERGHAYCMLGKAYFADHGET